MTVLVAYRMFYSRRRTLQLFRICSLLFCKYLGTVTNHWCFSKVSYFHNTVNKSIEWNSCREANSCSACQEISLKEFNSFYPPPTFLFKVCFKISLQLTFTSSEWSRPFRVLSHKYVCIPFMGATCLPIFHLVLPVTSDEKYRLCLSSLWTFPGSFFLVFYFQFFAEHPILEHPPDVAFCQADRPSFTPVEAAGKIIF
jgi:hypothetical protein